MAKQNGSAAQDTNRHTAICLALLQRRRRMHQAAQAAQNGTTNPTHHVCCSVTSPSASCVPGRQAQGQWISSKSRWPQPRSAMERSADALREGAGRGELWGVCGQGTGQGHGAGLTSLQPRGTQHAPHAGTPVPSPFPATPAGRQARAQPQHGHAPRVRGPVLVVPNFGSNEQLAAPPRCKEILQPLANDLLVAVWRAAHGGGHGRGRMGGSAEAAGTRHERHARTQLSRAGWPAGARRGGGSQHAGIGTEGWHSQKEAQSMWR